jgi:hypothetical protein
MAAQAPEVLELLKQVFSIDRITTREALARLGVQPATGVIDPYAVATRLGGPDYASAVSQSLNYARMRDERRIDAGALALDQLSARMGLSTNFTGKLGPREMFYPLAPGVTYLQALQPSLAAGAPPGIREYIKFNDTPMGDWDIPDFSHANRNVTVRHLGDVEELVRGYVAQHPESSIKLYQTPGGFRGWEQGVRSTPGDWAGFKEMLVDPDYAYLTTRGNNQMLDGLPLNQPGYSARISGKPGRPDWVAQPLATISGANAAPDPTSVQRILELHDEPIRQHFLGPGGVSPAAAGAVQRQLKYASRALRHQIGARLGL